MEMHQSPYICISLVKRIQSCKISVRLKWILTLLFSVVLFYSLCRINISHAGFHVARFTWQVGEPEKRSGNPWLCEWMGQLQLQLGLLRWQVRCAQLPHGGWVWDGSWRSKQRARSNVSCPHEG